MVTSTFSYNPSLAGVGTTITVPNGGSVLLSDSLVGSILNSYDFITNAKLKIQVPFNIFDKKFLPYMKELHEKGVEIHVRSTFLQGLFFKERKMREKMAGLSPEEREKFKEVWRNKCSGGFFNRNNE